MSTLVSIDLDGVDCYHAIHGLEAPTAEARTVLYQRWLNRALEFFAERPGRMTIFVIGRTLDDSATASSGKEQLQRALLSGHELANHSYGHAYDLSKWSGEDIYADLKRCDDVLRTLGAQPNGFRAPGYTHNQRMLRQVAALGYRYDSSLLPAPLYYFAKVGMQGLLRLRGRKSESVASGFLEFFQSRRARFDPETALWQIPIGVSPWLRMPMVGTFLLGPEGALLRAEAKRSEYLHIELHAIDFIDGDEDGLLDTKLVKARPEVRTSLKQRLDWLAEILESRAPSVPISRILPSRNSHEANWI